MKLNLKNKGISINLKLGFDIADRVCTKGCAFAMQELNVFSTLLKVHIIFNCQQVSIVAVIQSSVTT